MDYFGASTFPSVDESSPKTIYMGNLDSQITEDLLMALCSQYGTIKSCKLIKEAVSEPFAFIEYEDRQAAQMAITAMTGRLCFGRKMKLNWALPNGNTKEKIDTSKHFHIFVGDLGAETTEDDLIKAFSPYGMISDCRVVRDMHTARSKSYGFLSFVTKENAEMAINQMNGYWLGSRSIRTNWAVRKPYESGLGNVPKHQKKPSYEDVSNRTGPENCTVFCGKIPASVLSESLLKSLFEKFGGIVEIRVFQEKGYGFVKFIEKAAAVRAIITMNESEIHGESIKVSWGKEMSGMSSGPHDTNYYYQSYSNSSANQYLPSYGLQSAGMPYWPQPQGYQDPYSMLMQQQYYPSYNQNSQQQMPYFDYPASEAMMSTRTSQQGRSEWSNDAASNQAVRQQSFNLPRAAGMSSAEESLSR
ncbi:Nucleolysin TIAR [Orchesella cincta]|uniref:Nucleolysin TIAR n=1 Tax=Orchesella cincta TaxID=48709 RepID=A0A1D2MYK2_ORCCI|nr:Nucleolysin TIAR [Orchesella cincta]